MRRQESGFVFFTALIVLMSAISLSAVGLSRSLTEITATERFIEKQQAFQEAEAAIDDALATITLNPSLTLPYTPSTATANPTALSLLGSRTYTITSLGNGASRVTATGSSDLNISQTIEVVVQMPSLNPFQQAIFGEDAIFLDRDITVDSYDSTEGAYTPAPGTTNRTADGDIHTNSTDPNTVTLNQGVTIDGAVLVGDGGVPSVVIDAAAGVTVNGDDGPNLTLSPITVPSGTPCGSPLVVPKATSMTINLATSTCYTSITVSKDATLTINGDGQLTLGNGTATDLSVATGATLNITGTVTMVANEVNIANRLALGESAKLKLYASESCFLKGVVNSSQNPRNLSILYSGTADLTAGQSTSFYGTIYAPNATVNLHQSGDFFGAIVAKSVQFDQAGRLHFDTSLKDVTMDGSTGSGTPTILSWRQP